MKTNFVDGGPRKNPNANGILENRLQPKETPYYFKKDGIKDRRRKGWVEKTECHQGGSSTRYHCRIASWLFRQGNTGLPYLNEGGSAMGS